MASTEHVGISWGLIRSRNQRVVTLYNRFALPDFAPGSTHLAFGYGRSYGDCCLNDGGHLLSTRRLDRFIDFDRQNGSLTCESGVSLSSAMNIAVPRGWFLNVTPGTQFVTVGGAIANDVHGKNHHRAGSFGCHVEEFGLLRSSGEVLRCSRTANHELFFATIGGLGLTGLILWATIRLRRIASTVISGETVAFESLAEYLQLANESDAKCEYTVAWVDSFSGGRGILSRGNHLEEPGELIWRNEGEERRELAPTMRMANRFFVRSFNGGYFRLNRLRNARRNWKMQSFFYPLDRIRGWNRWYGKNGFFQHQCVVPADGAASILNEMLERISRSRQGSMLSVLKTFGSRSSGGLLAFPRPGVTMAIDFANHGDSTARLLRDLDALVMQAGGAVYPAKDATMSPRCFRLSFPRQEEFRAFIDPAFSSSFWRRVTS